MDPNPVSLAFYVRSIIIFQKGGLSFKFFYFLFNFILDPDPNPVLEPEPSLIVALVRNADPDPASKNNANPGHNHTDGKKALSSVLFPVPWEKLCVLLLLIKPGKQRRKLSMRGKVTRHTEENEKKDKSCGVLVQHETCKTRKNAK